MDDYILIIKLMSKDLLYDIKKDHNNVYTLIFESKKSININNPDLLKRLIQNIPNKSKRLDINTILLNFWVF
jgi:predicted transcriptional regulator